MDNMKRIYIVILAAFVLALALPATSPATITEVGVIPPTTTPPHEVFRFALRP